MPSATIPPDDDFDSLPSERTMRGAVAPRNDTRLAPGGDLLGRYTVLEELGQGGMGVVYKCLDREGGIEVAIKCLPPEVTRDRDELDEIRENYQIVARLHHSAISGLRYLERDPASGDYYVVMDLAEGEDLSRILRRRHGEPMPLADALGILRPLAAALDYAHGEKVLHRDVKPGNVKVRPPAVAGDPPRVQLLDFGLAAQVRSSVSRVSLRGHAGTSGTPTYMAPEQWEARRQGAATDQYALAVVAYEMLSGAPPFAADDTDLLRRAVLTRAPDPIDGLPESANAALLRGLAKDPKDRFPSCAAFVAALAGAADDGPSPPGEPRGMGAADRAQGSPRPGTAGPPAEPRATVSLDAGILRRKVSLARDVAAIPAGDADHALLGPFVREATTELSTAEEACRFDRFAVAADCLDRVEAALERWRTEKRRLREEAERTARETAERIQREKRAAAERAARKARAERRKNLLVWLIGLALLAGASAPFALDFSTSSSPKEEAATADKPVSPPKPQIIPQPEQTPPLPSGAGVRWVPTVAGRSLPLRWCPPGSFMMGSPSSEKGHEGDETQHRVTLTKGFWLGETEVTQGLWKKIMGVNPSQFPYDSSFPVEYVSWIDCQEFVEKLNAQAPVTGFKWALPTEAQWEYACRAGSTEAFAGTGLMDDMGWYDSNSDSATHPVGRKKANAWGFFDMHGNVWELCEDWYGPYPADDTIDPTGPASGSRRVIRGGSLCRPASLCRAAKRARPEPFFRGFSDRTCPQGLRIALIPVQ